MKGFFSVTLLFLSATLLAQQPAFHSQSPSIGGVSPMNGTFSEKADKNADTPQVKKKIAPASIKIHLLPLFGNYEKTPELKEVDEKFLQACDSNFKSRMEASSFFSQRAWDYLADGEKDTATYRFNLAYLLNDKNIDVYWGLGVIEFQRGNLNDAINLMKQGLTLDSKNATLRIDLATVYLQCYITDKKTNDLAKAFDLLDEAIREEPELPNAYMQLALAEHLNQQPDKAWEAFHKGYDLDPQNANPEILQALLSKLPDPKGQFK